MRLFHSSAIALAVVLAAALAPPSPVPVSTEPSPEVLVTPSALTLTPMAPPSVDVLRLDATAFVAERAAPAAIAESIAATPCGSTDIEATATTVRRPRDAKRQTHLASTPNARPRDRPPALS